MELEFDVQILKKDIYDYQLHHIYTSPSGLFGTIVGFFMIAAAFQTGTVILGIMGVFIIGYFPWILNFYQKEHCIIHLQGQCIHFPQKGFRRENQLSDRNDFHPCGT